MPDEAPVIDPVVRIIDLRNRALAGEELSKEEIAEALRLLAQNRRTAAKAPAKKKSTKKSSTPLPTNLDDLFKTKQ